MAVRTTNSPVPATWDAPLGMTDGETEPWVAEAEPLAPEVPELVGVMLPVEVTNPLRVELSEASLLAESVWLEVPLALLDVAVTLLEAEVAVVLEPMESGLGMEAPGHLLIHS